MANARLKVKPPHNTLALLTTEYPDTEFKLVAGYPTDEGITVLLDAPINDTNALRQHLEETPEVNNYEILHTDTVGSLVQYVAPEPEENRAALSALRIPSYPLILRDGWVFTELATARKRLSKFKDELERADITYEVLSVTESRDPTAILTDRQTQFVTEALERGYYDSPRQCSLSDLAAIMSVDKSTASRLLHRAEGRVLKEFFSKLLNSECTQSSSQ